ncbi:MAG: DNA repair protein RadA [Deltaproteobacteria bacterium]|nr:DNA repair protein RadA [Deltaproteobacteria bacterium]
MAGKSKPKTIFACQSCGYQSPKWLGKCPDCQQWNTLAEEVHHQTAARSPAVTTTSQIQHLSDFDAPKEVRYSSGMSELDRVLGGGFVTGSLTLIGGDPGIGKSTLLLQCMSHLGSSRKTLYVTAEESPHQVKLRADRLKASSEALFLIAETSLEKILDHVRRFKPAFLVIDSIQTIFSEELESAPGSVSQVRECGGRLMQLAKGEGVSTCIVGHVTKDGAIAGPRMLEHMVDTVLYFEGDPSYPYRILRTVKNRFGSTNEIGVFEMGEEGLREILNPSEIFLEERPEKSAGSVVVPSLEGSRPILVELQALVSSASFGTPQRSTIGIDHKKVSLLIAVLEKKAGLPLMGQDIFFNVAGGVRLDEPAVDLGVITALASSHLNKPILAQTVIFGEVGLTGEVRAVARPDIRVKEAQRLGFKRCFLPESNLKNLQTSCHIELTGVRHVQEILDKIFEN